MKIETKYDLFQKIFIKELEIYGVIKTILYDTETLQYNVRYFLDNKVNNCYFFEDELENNLEEKKVFGLK